MGFMGDAIQKGCGHAGIAKYLRPIPKPHIGGDHHRLAFMALGQDLENKLSAFFGKRHITQFIDDQQSTAA